MKISNDTRNIFKNFSTINQGIKVSSGNTLQTISNMKINISSVDTKIIDNIATTLFIISVNNIRQLNRLIKKLSTIKNVDYVERTTR